ncbi:hypothetical protein P8452_53312 [Trifolium repens]|nr:hypothetical protein P8452_53312 [Trifolium repens]
MVESLQVSERGMPNASNKQTINLSDPSLAASKGRPSNLQIKDSLELLNKGSPCCGYCKEKGHSKLKCPSFKHRRICHLKHNNDFQQDHKIHDAGDVTSPQLATWLYSRL